MGQVVGNGPGSWVVMIDDSESQTRHMGLPYMPIRPGVVPGGVNGAAFMAVPCVVSGNCMIDPQILTLLLWSLHRA